MEPLVSVIIPVYNVEKYVRKCLESVVDQSYRNLEIIIVDDGSTDGSGRICDEYKADKRVRVIHQSNKGLSGARNSGIDSCTGSYILFIDGDDYVELNAVEVLLKACIAADADVACCGHYKVFADRADPHPLTKEIRIYEGEELTLATMKGNCAHYAWEKLYKRVLFDECRFPEGMLFEDVATTWKILLKSNRVVCVPDVLFHYVYRKESLGNTKTMKNLSDRWMAFKERYDVMGRKSDELNVICTKGCLDTIGYTWRWLYIVKDRDEEKLQEMRAFAKEHRDKKMVCPMTTRIVLFCAVYSNPMTIAMCYCLNQIYRKLYGMKQTT